MDEMIFGLRKVIEKRRYSKEEESKIIGAEIRDRRISLSRTLVSLSYKICSVSYLCKIENNKILPNKLYVRELCKRLDLEDDKINELLHLNITLGNMVKYYFENDYLEIENAYKRGLGLLNYRFKIIEMIYYISKKDYYIADKLSISLFKMSSTMTDNDLQIFSLFYAILHFYNQDFEGCVEILNSLDVLKPRTKYITLLKYKYIFNSYICLNDLNVMFFYKEIQALFIENGLYDELDYLNYLFAIYLVKNNVLNELKKIYHRIKNYVYKRSISLYIKLKLNPYIKLKEKWLKNVNPYFYYLGLLKTNYNEACTKIEELNDLSFSVDFNILILRYLAISDAKDKYTYIINVAIPTLEKTKDSYSKKYFLDELCSLTIWLSKYKNFASAYDALARR